MSEGTHNLIRGRLLAQNAGWSLLAMGAPMAVAVVSIPMLIKGLGTERFGFLAIVWATIGLVSLFDLGLATTLTKVIAEWLGSGRKQDIRHLVRMGLGLALMLGMVWAVVGALLTPWLIGHILKVRPVLRTDGEWAFWILEFSFPFIVVSNALIGLLQAHQSFRGLSLINMASASLTFLGPLIALHWTPSLTAAVSTLTATRILACLAYLLEYRRVFPSIWYGLRFRPSLLPPLFQFWRWIAVSRVIGSAMTYLDRFLIGSLVGLSAAAYYATPYEVITRFLVIPSALASTLLPAYATSLAVDRERTMILFARAYRLLMLAMGPTIALVVLFAPEALSLWLGPSFAQHSTTVLRWLAIGVLMNTAACAPHLLILGAGRPDLVAKLHSAEFPLYITMLWLLLKAYGIEGAAIAWTVRLGMDALAHFYLAMKAVPATRIPSFQAAGATLMIGLAIGLLALPSGTQEKIACTIALLAAAVIVAYHELREVGWGSGPAESKV